MSEIADLPIVRRSALAAAAVAALALLLIFHSVVAGAVERAAQRRSDALAAVSLNTGRPAAFATGLAHLPTRKVTLAQAGG